MLVYWGDRSFKMTSNSDKLLAGKGTEETLAVVDKDILIESNDLETEFTAKVSKTPDIHSESCFWANIVDKRLKKKNTPRPTKTDCLWMLSNNLWANAKGSWLNYQCFESIIGELLAFVINKECAKSVNRWISNVVYLTKEMLRIFFPLFYRCTSDAENHSG